MKRLKILLYKLFGIKGFSWQVATALLCFGKISGAEWVTVTLIMCGLFTAQKWEGPTGKFNIAPDVNSGGYL